MVSSKGENLPIVVYQPKKYMDKSTISQIRSHAQKNVQHRKFVAEKKTEPEDHRTVSRKHKSSAVLASRRLAGCSEVPFTHFRTCELGRRFVVNKSATNPNSVTSLMDNSPALINAATSSGSAFPLQPDALFMHLVDRSYGIWEWNQRRDDFLRATLKEEGIYHGLLALAYQVYHRQTKKSIYHENATIHYLTKQLSKSAAYSGTDMAIWNSLMWCVCRLALVAYERHDLEAVSSHLNGMVTVLKFIPKVGPVEAWPQWQTVVGGMLLPSLPTWHTLPPELREIPSHIKTAACEDIELIGYTIDSTWLADIEATMELLSLDLVDVVQALHAVCTQPRPLKATANQQPVSFVKHAVRLALRAVKHHVNQTVWDISPESVLRACLCTAIVILGWDSGYPVVASSSAIKKCRSHARSLVSSKVSFDVIQLPRHWEPSENFFAWVLLVMGATSQETEEQTFYLNVFCGMFAHLADKTLAQLECMNYMIGWSKQWFGEKVEIFWGLVQNKLVLAS